MDDIYIKPSKKPEDKGFASALVLFALIGSITSAGYSLFIDLSWSQVLGSAMIGAGVGAGFLIVLFLLATAND